MKIEVKNLENCMQELTITVPAETAEKDYKKIIGKYKNKVNIPGFRKGKAPISLIERNYGEYIKEEFLDDSTKKYFMKALDEEDIHPVSEAEPVKVEWDHDKDFVAVIKFEVMPEVEVKEYDGMEVEFEEREIKDSDVELFVERLRENMALTEIIETEIEKGYFVDLDITKEDSDLNFQRKIEVGENIYSKDLNEKLIGKKTGDEFTSVIFDEKEEADSEEMEKFRGVVFNVKIGEVEKKELPEVNDEFAADLGHDNLEEMKEKLRKELEERNNAENIKQKHNAVLAKLVELNPVEIPRSMTIGYAKQLAEDAVKQYNIEMDQAVQLYMGIAEFNLKTFNLQNKLKEILKLEVTDEYKENILKEAAENMKMDLEEYKKMYKKQLESAEFIESIKDKMVLDYLVENSKFVTPKPVEKTEEQED